MAIGIMVMKVYGNKCFLLIANPFVPFLSFPTLYPNDYFWYHYPDWRHCDYIRQEAILRYRLNIIIAGMLLFSAFACAPSANHYAGSRLTVGILNEFPDIPNYIKKRTLVFMHDKKGYDSGRFKDVLTQSASKFILSKGHRVIEVDDRTALNDGRADMILQIQPLDIYKQEGTRGYGFYDRAILGVVIKQAARSYVCMNVNLYRKDSIFNKRSGRQESFSKLIFSELPDSPDQLTADQKKSMSVNLEQNIRETITRVLPMMGF